MRGSVRKDTARGTWYFVADVGVDPRSGSRRQLRRRGFRTRRLAEDALRAVFAESADGDYVGPSSQPLRLYLERWLQSIATTRKPSTAAMYGHKLRRYVIPRLGAMPLRQLDAAALVALYAELRESGGRPDANGNPTDLSESTVSVVHRILHRALADAVRRRVIRSNPASDAQPPRSSKPREMQVWDAGQLRTFLASIDGDRLQPLWMVAATTGLRRGEVCGLMWSDVNFDTSNLSVQRSRVPIAGRVVEGTPKSDRARVIALAPQAVAALRHQRARQLQERLACAEAWNDSGYMFTTENGSPLRPDWLTARFDELAAGASLPRIRFHGIRHSFATLALAANVHPKVVQEVLGHANVGITLDLYSHIVPGMQAEATSRIAALVLGS